jgi:hypothetical protein
MKINESNHNLDSDVIIEIEGVKSDRNKIMLQADNSVQILKTS